MQLRLDFADYRHVLCAYGQPMARYTGYAGPHHCVDCATAVDEACAAFAAAVDRREYDEQGYTPAERRAAARAAREIQ